MQTIQCHGGHCEAATEFSKAMGGLKESVMDEIEFRLIQNGIGGRGD